MDHGQEREVQSGIVPTEEYPRVFDWCIYSETSTSEGEI